MSATNRRGFIQTAGAGVTVASLSAASMAKVIGANERVRVALVGCGGRGTYDAGVFDANANATLTAIADVHKGRLTAASKRFPKAKAYDDFRKVLDDKQIDAVIIATPVHWHGPGTVAACNAGKHVYVEKPCSHNIREGRALIEASRRSKRLVQHGTQVRSTPTIQGAVDLLRNGIIGDVMISKAWNIQRRAGVGMGSKEDPPKELNFGEWLGPVPPVDFHGNLFRGWNWFKHFGTGEIGNDGIHDIDYARWGLGVETHPSVISAIGGRYVFNNGAEFPDTQQVTFEYPSQDSKVRSKILIYEERLWSTNYPHNCDSGVEFYGTKGQMFVTRRGKLQVLSSSNKRVPVEIPLVAQDTNAHVANFVESIREQKQPNANAEVAHLTTSLCHLGNISIQLGRSLRFDPEKETFDDDQANQLLGRTYNASHWAALK